MKRHHLLIGFLLALAISVGLRAQQAITINAVVIQTQYAMQSISATAGATTQATLTIPAPPPSFYNYICTLHFNASHDATTTTAITNGVTTSTNMNPGNTWAIKFSLQNATATGNYDWYENWGVPNVGCAKSVAPGTPTTFLSPTGTANVQFMWEATFYQAP